MKLYGGIHLDEGGMYKSVRSMHLQQSTMGIINRNIVGFGKVGYQKEVPVVTSFTQYLGSHALSSRKNDEVGRIKLTKNPLDLVLASKGYFQAQTPYGVKLTRDGRFKIDLEGNLLTLENFKVLSSEGEPVKLDKIPRQLENIKIDTNGQIKLFDPDSLKFHDMGTIAAVDSEKKPLKEINMKQGYVEESNVSLHEEAYSLITVRRNFQANRQLFIIQNDSLAKTIQELGRA